MKFVSLLTTKEKNKISHFPNQSASPLSPYLALHVCHDAKIQQFPRHKIPLSKGILGCLVKQALVLVVKLFVEEVELEGQAVGVPKAVGRRGTEVLVCTTLPPSWIRAISQGWIKSFGIWTKISISCLEFEMSTNGFGQLMKKKTLHFVFVPDILLQTQMSVENLWCRRFSYLARSMFVCLSRPNHGADNENFRSKVSLLAREKCKISS